MQRVGGGDVDCEGLPVVPDEDICCSGAAFADDLIRVAPKSCHAGGVEDDVPQCVVSSPVPSVVTAQEGMQAIDI